MAQKTEVVTTDDIDGSPATQTVTFAFQGATYEIDLNDEHAAAIEESFAEWISSARKAARTSAPAPSGSARPAGPKRSDLDAVRSWARENGWTVSDRGRVSQKVLDAYDGAQG